MSQDYHQNSGFMWIHANNSLTHRRHKTRYRLDACEYAVHAAFLNPQLVCMSLCWWWPLGVELWGAANNNKKADYYAGKRALKISILTVLCHKIATPQLVHCTDFRELNILIPVTVKSIDYQDFQNTYCSLGQPVGQRRKRPARSHHSRGTSNRSRAPSRATTRISTLRSDDHIT